jgi:class 3 adenylate cyclase
VAAEEAQAALSVLGESASPAGEPPLGIVIAHHYGTVIYSNIGAATRLDSTVIGAAGQSGQLHRSHRQVTRSAADRI